MRIVSKIRHLFPFFFFLAGWTFHLGFLLSFVLLVVVVVGWLLNVCSFNTSHKNPGLRHHVIEKNGYSKKILFNVNIGSLLPDMLFSFVHFRSLKQENPFTFLGELDLLLSSPALKTYFQHLVGHICC